MHNIYAHYFHSILQDKCNYFHFPKWKLNVIQFNSLHSQLARGKFEIWTWIYLDPKSMSCIYWFHSHKTLSSLPFKFTSTAAAAAAKSLQSCPTLCNPIDDSPLGSPVPGILQERILEWVAISFSNAWKWKVKVKSLSCVPPLATPWTAAYQAPPSMGFSRQEYWSGLPLPSPLCLRKEMTYENINT